MYRGRHLDSSLQVKQLLTSFPMTPGVSCLQRVPSPVPLTSVTQHLLDISDDKNIAF